MIFKPSERSSEGEYVREISSATISDVENSNGREGRGFWDPPFNVGVGSRKIPVRWESAEAAFSGEMKI